MAPNPLFPEGKRTRDIELPNESRTIDPRLPDAPRRQYAMDVVDLEASGKMDPAMRRMKLGRMNRYLDEDKKKFAPARSMRGGKR